VEILGSGKQALRASEVATLFRVTHEHTYKMATKGILPSWRSRGHGELYCPLQSQSRLLIHWMSSFAALLTCVSVSILAGGLPFQLPDHSKDGVTRLEQPQSATST